MGRLRVLQFISGVAIGDQSGGAELHALQVALHLDKEHFDPLICAAWSYGSPNEVDWLERLASEEIRVTGLLAYPEATYSKLAQAFRTLWSVVSQFQPHIIHSHSERYDSINALVRTLHPNRSKAVRTIHLDRRWQTRPRLGPIIDSYLFPYFFAYEIGVSQEIYQQLRDTSRRKEDKVGLCYNAIDVARFTGNSGARSSNVHETVFQYVPCIGIVGRLTEQKGHADLIKALAMVAAQQPVHLLIVGDGPLKSDLVELVDRLGLTEQVSFLGTRIDAWERLPNIELFVLPSYWEGFPTVILEAMAQRIPVIASDIPGNRELVRDGKTGILVPKGDVSQLSKVILWALDNAESMNAMAAEAKKLTSEYTLQNMAACYAQIYQNLFR